MKSGSLLAGRYRLTRPLASGGMGHVWVARDEQLGRDVAVKVQAVGSREDAAAVERFRREARATAALQHPNIVTIYDSGTDGDTAFIVMELLPGPTVADKVGELGRLPERLARDVAVQVASGLAAAHAAGVIHRDIKPSNLVFDGRETVKIVDFGIARLAQAAGAGLTAANTVIGSAAYLSPEQVEGRTADERSDLYALGCVLTTMLTGAPPFAGESPLAIAHQHLHRSPASLLDTRPDVDPGLARLVDALLQKDPARRPASAEQVLGHLRASGETAPLPTTPMPTGDATEVLGAPGATRVMPASRRPAPPAGGPPRQRPPGQQPPRQQPPRGQRRRRSGWRRVATLAVLLVAGLLAWSLLSGPDGSGETPPAAAPSSSTPAPSKTKEPTTPPAPSEASGPSFGDAVSELGGTIAAAGGELGPKEALELIKKANDFVKKSSDDEGKDAAKQAEDLQKYVEDLVDEGALSSGTAERIDEAIQQLLAASGGG